MAAKQKNRTIVLAAMPGTQKQIVERTGLGQATVSRWCNVLHAADQCHIGGWYRAPNGGPFAEVFHAGQGKDKDCYLRPTTMKERSRKYHRNLKRSGEHEDVLARARSKYWLNKPARRDSLTAALFGAA